MIDWSKIITKINHITNRDEKFHSYVPVSGGDINSAYQLTTKNSSHYFIKLNHFNLINMFIAEFEALKELNKYDCISTPYPICYGQLANYSFIIMEFLPLQSRGNDYILGQNLAKMHKISQNQFGWKMDNTIGSTHQSNQQSDNWIKFWKTQRLTPQFAMLFAKGYKGELKKKSQDLLSGLDEFFQGYQPIASLLHGDLWSGNYAFNHKGHGVIFDPALYYGDREIDLAMTELFGGFSKDFYIGYEDEFELEHGYKNRKLMYNLYHILNHANLFGGSYIKQALSNIDIIIKKAY